MKKLALNENEMKKLEKRNLSCYEQAARLVPARYYDCRYENGLSETYNGYHCCVIGELNSIEVKEMDGYTKKGRKMFLVKAAVRDRISGRKLNVFWFNRYDVYKEYRFFKGRDFLVYGLLAYDENYHSFKMVNPVLFTDDITFRRIIPEYKTTKDISSTLVSKVMLTAGSYPYEEYLPYELLDRYNLPDIKTTEYMLHHPKTPEDINAAYKRLVFDDLLYFSISIKNKNVTSDKPYPYIATRKITDEVIASLPYSLTTDQKTVVDALFDKMHKKQKINALIQGDVGCGKTITTFLAMIIAAENGYQSVLMAPTEVLAKQHYKELKELGHKIGYETVYLGSSLTPKQKKDVYEKISSGDCKFIVGTHSVASEGVIYSNLGLIAIDEEHKFGVAIKESLKNKSPYNTPYITLSATPIPRSMGELVYGEDKQIFEIKSMPDGRQSVETTCYAQEGIPPIVDKEIAAGHQVYVVCPQIEKGEEDKKEGLKRHSVEEILEMYEKHFVGTSVKIGRLTGKSNKKTSPDNKVLESFMNNEIQILVSTTVIEVGVNNPNATVIVIQDADCYGLSTMHQLRGRVKRGNFKPYCLLVSPNGTSNPRLQILCDTEDGFKIAEEDYKLRKAGNIIGLEQSGQNKYIDLINTYPNMYQIVRNIAAWMIASGYDKRFITYMDELEKNEETG